MTSKATMENNTSEKIVSSGGKFITTSDGRIVEYSVHGKCNDDDVPVIVNPYCAEYLIFNKCTLSKVEMMVDYSTVNYKLISISLPGIGHSDLNPGLVVADWPETDLLPILQQENVLGKFHMCGVSLGSLYAVATAQTFRSRIASLGVRVPYLPLPVSEPLGLPEFQSIFPSSDELAKKTMTVRITRFIVSIYMSIFAIPGPWTSWCMKKGLFGSDMVETGKFFEDYPKETAYEKGLVAYFPVDTMMHLTAKDVALDAPGVDAREISVQEIPMDRRIVWYAAVDQECPPSHGKWLAEVGWKGCQSRVFEGYDHIGGASLDHGEFLDTLVRIGQKD